MAASLVATLGSEPQVISIGAQLLTRQGVTVSRVTAVHTDAAREPIRTSIRLLRSAFHGHPEWPHLSTIAAPVDDVLSAAALDRYADTLYRVLQERVAKDEAVHLLLAGGRKSMAMVGITVAQLLFGNTDHVWHLFSDESLRTSGRFELLDGDHAELTPVRLAPSGIALPKYTTAFQASSPDEARKRMDFQHNRQVRAFLGQILTPAEAEVAKLAAGEVLTVSEMASRLSKTPKTITNQLNTIYSKMESYFGLQPDLGVKREFLRREIGPYFRDGPMNLGVDTHDDAEAMR